MTTAAIYARYSSELQSDRSIEDQIELAKAYAAREGLIVTAAYEDRAQSGSSTQGRLGLARMLRDANDRLFTHLIVESLDRLSRDQADLATLYKRLTFIGIEIREVHGGKATPLNAAVRGLVGTLYLADLADKTRRGLAGRVREGKSAGGKAYGYRPVTGQPGALEIVPDEAEAVRLVFQLYADGASPRDIAGRLNRDGVPPPRGCRWNASTINGSRQRSNGILGNTLYAGEMVWNRTRMVKDPETGRRVSRPNPESEWQRRHVDELRIVDAALWAAVQARRRQRPGQIEIRFKPKRLLSGLLKCDVCGGSLVIRDHQSGKARVECSTHKESRSCSNGRIFYLDRIERAVVQTLKDEMTNPDALAEFVREYNAERRRLASDVARNRGKIEGRLKAVTAEIERIVTLMVKGLVEPERHAPRLKELEAEEKRLKADLAAAAVPQVLTLHPTAIARYRAQLETLESEIAKTAEPSQALRDLIERVIVRPNYEIEIVGRLAELTGIPAYPSRRGGLLVAGERFAQSPTFRLMVAA
jgi:site-specific DNA recombinase